MANHLIRFKMKKRRILSTVYYDGRSYEGFLYLGKRDEVFVDLKDCFICNEKIPLIKCSADGKTFYLHNSDLCYGRIYSKYIVDSYNCDSFSSFEFYLDGVSEWLQSLDDGSKTLFKESIKIDSVEYVCSAVLKKKKIVVTVESINHLIELNSIEFIVQQFARLFSFLCYNKVACSSASIRDNKKKYPVYSFLFSESKYKLDCRYSLLSARLIHTENLWSVILHNYFETRSKFFEGGLNNFWGQINFEGYWGHEFLDVFAILDRYTKMTNVGKTAKVFSATSVNSVVHRVKDFIISQENLSDDERRIFSLLPGKIQKMNAWNESNSAKSRIHYLLSKEAFFNTDERTLFALIDANLKRLLDLRDKIAHGECLDSQGGRIYNNFSPLIYQLKILAAWVIYRELGIPSKIIWLGTRDSRHNDVRNAEIDTTRLSVMIDDIPVFQVPKKTFDYFSKMRIDSCFIYNPKTNCLIFDESLSKKAEKELHEGQYGSIENAVSKIAPQYNRPVYLSRILIECGSVYKTIWGGVVIVNYECLPLVLQEKCKKWMRLFPKGGGRCVAV